MAAGPTIRLLSNGLLRAYNVSYGSRHWSPPCDEASLKPADQTIRFPEAPLIRVVQPICFPERKATLSYPLKTLRRRAAIRSVWTMWIPENPPSRHCSLHKSVANSASTHIVWATLTQTTAPIWYCYNQYPTYCNTIFRIVEYSIAPSALWMTYNYREKWCSLAVWHNIEKWTPRTNR